MLILIIDDLRNTKDIILPDHSTIIITRSSKEAIDYLSSNKDIYNNIFISFDHDLGGEDTAMIVVKWLYNNNYPPPNYQVHSANPIGKQNIISYIESWKRVIND